MGTVIPFERKLPEREYLLGEAICTTCRHTWAAMVPMGSVWLECPDCGAHAGRFRMPFVHEAEQHYVCHCDNDLLRVTEQRVYCPACGMTLSVPKPPPR